MLDVQTTTGSVYDFKFCKDTCPDWLPDNTYYLADSGYQGIAKLHETTFILFKEPRNGQTLEICEKANNYLAKFLVRVEHKIGLLKLFKIFATKYRNRNNRYDFKIKLFASIANFQFNLLLLQEV
ncbi:transposase family protein [Psychrobacter phenylpyruvicus]|uniref:transposase family protein n=1 Tax=Psychrobacter phenylpyruvicus TaxID=29432 RepID=UPI0009DDBBE0